MQFYRGSDNRALGSGGARGPVPPTQTDAAIVERQAQAFVEALKPRHPGRPLVAVLALNEGTETTDLLLPHAVLQRAGVADVHTVAPCRGRVFLYPALQIEVAEDLASFDQLIPRAPTTWLFRQCATTTTLRS